MALQLTAEEKKLLETFERGRLLQQVVRDPGWKVVLDVMEEEVAAAEFRLMNYAGGDQAVAFGLQRQARAMRLFFQNIQARIHAAITDSEEVPRFLAPQSPVGDLGFTI